ncbi:MAG TPA: TlpA disulfide reductase family protein [Chitinophagaceae bacterium]|nr:TlpA disulfide reductase family protein [Chitinophagaceae bacterium]
MKRLIAIIAFFPLVSSAQDKAKTFKLSGKTTNLAFKPEWVYLQYRTNGEWKTDSIKAENGAYNFEGKIEEPSISQLRVKYMESEPGKKVLLVRKRDIASVYLQPGKIRVSSVDSFSNIQVKGSAAHTEYAKLAALKKPYEEKMEPLYALYTYFNKNKEVKAREKVESMIDSIDRMMTDRVFGEYVRKNPGSPVAVYALQQYAGWNIDADKVEPLFNTLSETNRKYPSAIDFKETIDIAKKTGIGKIAMDFTQNDTLGNPVTLSSLRGRYLLIDFWASWCGPCRNENPNVVASYHRFKEKNFTVLGVSLDKPGQKDKWLDAIHADNLAWTQVSDLQFWNNEVAKQYRVQGIPQNFLIGPDGKILAKNLRGPALEQKLCEVLGGCN